MKKMTEWEKQLVSKTSKPTEEKKAQEKTNLKKLNVPGCGSIMVEVADKPEEKK
jgi:hypothetical protein